MQAYLISLLLLWVSVALQGAWPVWLRIGEQGPQLVVAVIVCIGLVRGAVQGCLAGLVGAVLVAGAGHIPLGGLFAGYMLVGALAGFLRGSLFAERAMVAVLMAAVGVILSEFVRLIFQPPPEFFVWLRATLHASLFTAVFAPVTLWAAKFARPPEPVI